MPLMLFHVKINTGMLVDSIYWGDGGDGSGKNMLGRILMQVRKSLSSGSIVI